MASGFLGGLSGGAIGSAVVRLVLDDSQYTTGLAQAKGETVAATNAMTAQASKFGLATEAALLPAVGAFGLLTGAAVAAAMESEQVLAQLRAQVGENTQAYEEQALALQRVTGASDEMILAADTVLARFQLTETEIRSAIPVILDYAQATGKDVPAAAGAIGKALLGNTRALKEVGIEFTATGNRGKDFAFVLDALNEKVGGTARAFGETAAGQLAIAREEFDNLLETVGAEILPAITDLVPIVTDLAEAVTPILSSAVGDAATALEGFAVMAETVGDAVTGLLGVIEELGVETDGLGLSMVGVVEQINPTAARFIELARTVGEYEQAQQEATEATADWYAETFQAKRSGFEEFMYEAAESAGLLADKESALERETERANEQIERQVSRLYDLQSAQLELAGGVLGLIESARSYTETQDEVNRLEARGKENTDDYREAVGELLSKRLQLEKQFIDFGTQLLKENATVADARAALREYGREADLTKAQMQEFMRLGLQPIRGELDEINEGIEEFDGKNATATLTLNTQLIGTGVLSAAEIVSLAGLGSFGTANGGIIRGARGFVTRKPTYLVGEGGYSTFAGRGAEAVIPLDQRGIEILAEAVRKGTSGSGVTINLHGDVYGYDDFVEAVNDAMTSAIMVGG